MESFDFYPWLGAMALLVFSNNVVGMLEAIVTDTFDKAKALLGAVKSVGVALSLMAFFYAGTLVPNIEFQYENMVFTLNGILAILMFGVIGFLAVKAVKKIAELIGVHVPTKEDLAGKNPTLGE